MEKVDLMQIFTVYSLFWKQILNNQQIGSPLIDPPSIWEWMRETIIFVHPVRHIIWSNNKKKFYFILQLLSSAKKKNHKIHPCPEKNTLISFLQKQIITIHNLKF